MKTAMHDFLNFNGEEIIIKAYLKLLNSAAKVNCYNFTNKETETQ